MSEDKDLVKLLDGLAITVATETEQEEKPPASINDLPQELIDAVVQPLLPTRLLVQTSLKLNDEDLDAWKRFFKLGSLSRKVRKAVDDAARPIKDGQVPMKVILDSETHTSDAITNPNTFEALFSELNIRTITIVTHFSWTEWMNGQLDPDIIATITLARRDRGWQREPIKWEGSRDTEEFRELRGFFRFKIDLRLRPWMRGKEESVVSMLGEIWEVATGPANGLRTRIEVGRER